jgi:hypothetical protein
VAACDAFVVIVNRSDWWKGLESWGDEVAAAYDDLSRKLPIDKNRVFLFGASAETTYISQFVSNSPVRWAGVILLNPTGLPDLPKLPMSGPKPRFLLSAGGMEGNEKRLKEFQQQAVEHGVMVDVVISPGEAHHFVGNVGQLQPPAPLNILFSRNDFMEAKWVKTFILSAGGLLLAAGLIRFLIAVGGAQAMSMPEPLLGIPLLYAVLAAGAVELTVAWICLSGKNRWLQIVGLAWIATVFVSYRIALLWEHVAPQGACWGTLTDPLHISRGATGFIVGLMPFYLVLGSCAAGVWSWRDGGFSQTTISGSILSRSKCQTRI